MRVLFVLFFIFSASLPSKTPLIRIYFLVLPLQVNRVLLYIYAVQTIHNATAYSAGQDIMRSFVSTGSPPAEL